MKKLTIHRNMTYFFLTLGILLVLDYLWLTSMSEFYRRELAPIVIENFRFTPILIFYPLYAFAIYMLAVLPSATLLDGLWRGALLGLAAYGAYDFTNYATLKHFTFFIVWVDLLWGTFLTMTVSGTVTYLRVLKI